MLPGMSRCPTNWDLDYKGWLMGGTNRPSTPICVVSEPAAVSTSVKISYGGVIA